MKILNNFFILIIILMGITSICMAEEWYEGMERSSNDYRGSVGAMISDVDGAKYTPRYTAAQLQTTRAVADSRQVMQSTLAVSRINQAVSSAVTASPASIPGAVGPHADITPPTIGGAPGGGLGGLNPNPNRNN